MPSLAKKMNRAWMFRWNQKIDESMNLLAEIQLETKWGALRPENLKLIAPKKMQECYVEALLLKGSLLRAQGQLQKSSAWLRNVSLKNDETLESRGFRLQFEMGIDHWVHEDTPEALECFLLAEKEARTEPEKYFCYFNLLLCLEDLDMPREHIEEKLSVLISKKKNSLDFRHLEEQWLAYRMRQKFFSEMHLLEAEKIEGQGLYFSSWVNGLPYFNQNWQEKILFDWEKSYVWQGAYRARTLAGVWLPADQETPLVVEAISRLYLWTWWWLGDHPQIGTDKIIWTLESILRSLEMETQSKANLLLLRNSLCWIVLVEPGLEKKVERILQALKKRTSSRYQSLEIEFALNQAILQGRLQKTQLALEKSIKRFSSYARILEESVCFTEDALLPRLQRRLHPLKGQAEHACLILVDLSRQEIRMLKSYRVLRSQSLSRLLSLIHQFGTASFEDILDTTEEVDPRKIYNLVVRARKLTSYSALKIRGKEVVRGTDWPSMMILNQSFDPTHLSTLPVSPMRGFSLIGSKSHLQVAKALLPGEFNRKEVQKILKVSKATACRMIEKWIQDEFLEAIGKARAVRYQWNAKGGLK